MTVDATARLATGRVRPSATLIVVVSAFCFSTLTIFTTLATRAGTPLVTLLFFRYLIAACLLLPFAGSRAALRVTPRQIAGLALFAGVAQASVSWLTLAALVYIPAATLVFLFYTYPAWVAVIGALRGTERIDRARGAALLLSFSGVALMVGLPGSAAIDPSGAALALAAAILYAIYIPMLPRLGAGLAPAVTTIWIATGTAAAFAVAGMVTGTLTATLPLVSWMSVLGLAVIATAVAFVLLLRGLALLGPVPTAIISTVEPFFVTLLAAVVLDQAVTASTIGGGALIAAAVLLLHRFPGSSAINPV